MSHWKESAEYKLLQYTRSILVEKQWLGDFGYSFNSFNLHVDICDDLWRSIHSPLRERFYSQLLIPLLPDGEDEKDRELP